MCILCHMATVSIRIHNVPNDLIAEAKRAAQLTGQSMSGWIMETIRLRLEAKYEPQRHPAALEPSAAKSCRIYGCLMCKEMDE